MEEGLTIHYLINMPAEYPMKGSTPKQQTLIDSITSDIGSELNLLSDRINTLEHIDNLIHVESKTGTNGSGLQVPVPFDTVVDKLLNFKHRLITSNDRIAGIISHLETII